VPYGLQILSDGRMLLQGCYNRVVPMVPGISWGRLALHLLGRAVSRPFPSWDRFHID
jgi:hypothetical protein